MGVTYDDLLGKVLLHTHDPLVLTDSNGIPWNVTVSTSGTLVVTQAYKTGQPMGLLLTLTYSS